MRRENDLPWLRARLVKVSRILKQLRHHDRKYVDTDAWMEGVIQRVPAAALAERLTDEEAQLTGSIAEAEADVAFVGKRVLQIEEETRSTVALTHRVSGMRESIEQSSKAIRDKTPVQELQDQVRTTTPTRWGRWRTP